MFDKLLFSLVGILIVYSRAIACEKSDVEISVDNIEDSWYDDEDVREFDRLIRRHLDKESYPKNLRLFINFPKIHRSEKRKDQARISNSEFEISPSTSSFLLSGWRDETEQDRKKTLPYEFSYVAREFYRQYTQQRMGDSKKKVNRKIFYVPENISPSNTEDYPGSVNSETTQLPDDTTIETAWRSIINAPTSGCPKGQRKDRNGRCRKTL